jgi:hypothetical protein
MNSLERLGPLAIVQEDLGDVAGHCCEVDLHRRQISGDAMDQLNEISTVLPPRDCEHRGGRIYTDHAVEPALREKAGESPRPATDIEDGSSAELSNDRRVDRKVTSVRVQNVVDLGQTRFVKDAVGHDESIACRARQSHLHCDRHPGRA